MASTDGSLRQRVAFCSAIARLARCGQPPRNAGVSQTENEPVSLLISEHEGLVGNLAVSSNPFECLAQGLRRRHVLAVRARQSHGAMNAPAHIPFCALRAMASSATYALEYRTKAMPRPSRTSHALRSPSFVEQVASHRPKASLPLVAQEVSRDPMYWISRLRATIPQFQSPPLLSRHI
jgi:hypothetical protein